MDNEISSKEVEAYKNFDALLRSHRKAVLGKRLLLSLIPISIIIGAALTFYSIVDNQVTVGDIEPLPNNTLAIADSTQYTKPEDTVGVKRKLVEQLKKKVSTAPKESIKKEPIPAEVNQQYSFVKATPDYGMDSLMNYLNIELNNKKFTQISGNILVAFTIDINGNSSSIKIIQSLSQEIDNEIINLIGNMPAWKPAMMNGKPVSSTTTLPIKVEIKTVHN